MKSLSTLPGAVPLSDGLDNHHGERCRSLAEFCIAFFRNGREHLWFLSERKANPFRVSNMQCLKDFQANPSFAFTPATSPESGKPALASRPALINFFQVCSAHRIASGNYLVSSDSACVCRSATAFSALHRPRLISVIQLFRVLLDRCLLADFPCGKTAVAKCSDCGSAICADCQLECCGDSFCEPCHDYHVTHSCVKKPVQNEHDLLSTFRLHNKASR